MRSLTLLLLLALGGCGSNSSPPDMHLLSDGEECVSGLGAPLGTCAPGLKCCIIQCPSGSVDGGQCLDLPSRCTSAPPANGQCF